jgi:hypothetical protein
VICCVWGWRPSVAEGHGLTPVLMAGEAFVQTPMDTIPPPTPTKPPSWFRRSIHEIANKHYRDSILSILSRENVPAPGDDTSMNKSEHFFMADKGKVIRRIYFRRVQVFGPNDIYDTGFYSTNKLLKLANNMHYDSRQWVISASLFFKKGDTINAYMLADNERYLRNLPFIQDARIYITHVSDKGDSVDLNVVTKDVFEYGGELDELSTNNAKLRVYNNDLFGAGQSLTVGYLWDNTYSPTMGTQVQYTKSNIGGTFIDGSVGYSTMNSYTTIDSGVYEGSRYFMFNRPLYRSVTALIGGLYVANNYSMNIHSLSDSLFRNYKYNIVDGWVGWNFRPQQKRSGEITDRPSLALLLRHYNLFFTEQPTPYIYRIDQTYNNRRYLLGELAVYKQSFFKSHYFFEFGRTEDIPLGYNIGLYAGQETWDGRQRSYGAFNAQKYWVTPLKGLLSTSAGVSSFYHGGNSEDAVFHAEIDYYSRLINFNWGRMRQFLSIDYLDCPNPYFYKPLQINQQFGIYGIENTQINGFQRINMRSQTNFYSPIKFYGFKFNFDATVQTSQLGRTGGELYADRFYSGFGLGCMIRNENLAFNTLKVDGNYYPTVPPGMRGNWFFEITSITDFRFNIFPLSRPQYLNYQ